MTRQEVDRIVKAHINLRKVRRWNMLIAGIRNMKIEMAVAQVPEVRFLVKSGTSKSVKYKSPITLEQWLDKETGRPRKGIQTVIAARTS